MDHINWHGVAMVEFKVSSDGIPYIMEVNPRFWGSLQLAIDSEVDFPYMLYKLAIGDRVQKVDGYKVGIKNRWLLGDLDHLYLIVKNPSQYHNLPSRWVTILKFLNFFEKNMHYEVNRWDDLKPFIFELKTYFL